jgi:hypothetical protein
MKLSQLLTTVLLNAAAAISQAAPLSANDRAAVLGHLEAVRIAAKNNDFDTIASLTFEPLMKLFGGRDAFIEVMTKSQHLVETSGLEVISSRSLEPSEVLDAGEYEACVVPEEHIMRIKEVNLRDLGFTIALRRKGTNEWRLFGGAGLRRNPQVLKMLLPEFPDTFQLPKNTTERLSQSAPTKSNVRQQ